jgi:uncharacterized spore protein YtfJ
MTPSIPSQRVDDAAAHGHTARSQMTIDETMSTVRRSVEETRADRLVERLAERIGARTGVQAVFGEPIRSGDTVVVPVARVRWGVGGGGGWSDAENASGSGGGGGVVSDPVGYVVISGDGAEYRPISRPWTSPVFVLSAAAAVAMVLGSLPRLRR